MRFLDLRAAIRSLTRSPGFLTAAVLSLSVAIGASAAAFSVVDAVRFRTLPFPDGERLVVRWWPGQDALGRTIRVDTVAGAAPVVVTIVGVVGDNRAAEPNLLLAGSGPGPTTLLAEGGAELYRPYEQAPSAFPTFIIRTSGAPESLLRPARELPARLVPDRPVFATLVSYRVDDQVRGVRVNALQIPGMWWDWDWRWWGSTGCCRIPSAAGPGNWVFAALSVPRARSSPPWCCASRPG